MFKLIGGILIPVVFGIGSVFGPHAYQHFKCITKGQHHQEICVPVKWSHK